MHLGYFRGVDNAIEIRDLVLEQMRGRRDSGLGDPDEANVGPATVPATEDGTALLSASRELLTEAKRLRSAVGT